MAFMFTRVVVSDYDEWQQRFNADPYGAREKATSHRVCRGSENPDELFIQVEFPSVEEAQAAREKLIQGGLRDHFDEITGPTVAVPVEVGSPA